MTGDGAVVREWPPLRLGIYFKDAEGEAIWNARLEEHNAAIRQQAAEIERLTRERDEFETMYHECADKRREGLRITADLNKEMWAARDKVAASEARTADLLKALERYGRHSSNCALEMGEEWRGCTCGLAAAKGETV